MKTVTKIDAVTTSQTAAKLRVAAYARVSTDSDAQLESLEAQKSHYESYITSRDDWVFAGLYYDEGISGTKTDKRTALQQLITDCEAHKIDYVITKSISRFSRNTTDCLMLVRKLLMLNIPIFFEKENIDTGNMESELFLSVLSSMAESESVSIAENNKWSIQKRYENGTYKISVAPYGYRKASGSLEIDEAESVTVRRIFSEYISGKSAESIAKELKSDGVPTRKGGKWSDGTIRSMLMNITYTGDLLMQKTYTDEHFTRHVNHGEKNMYHVAGHHKAIIDKSTFEAAQTLIHKRAGHGEYRNRYAFSGIITCGECGGTFKRRIHGDYIAWCCATHISDKAKCNMLFVREKTIKAAFCTMMNKLIFSYRQLLKPYVGAMKAATLGNASARTEWLKRELALIAKRHETLTKLMAQGIIDRSVYIHDTNELVIQAKQYKAEVASITKSDDSNEDIVEESVKLLRYTEAADMLTDFDEELFTRFVSGIVVNSRTEIAFSLKCGLTLTERT